MNLFLPLPVWTLEEPLWGAIFYPFLQFKTNKKNGRNGGFQKCFYFYYLRTGSETRLRSITSSSSSLSIRRGGRGLIVHFPALQNKVQTPQQVGQGFQSYLPLLLTTLPNKSLTSCSFNMLHIFILHLCLSKGVLF